MSAIGATHPFASFVTVVNGALAVRANREAADHAAVKT
jgi:hypothetical protein